MEQLEYGGFIAFCSLIFGFLILVPYGYIVMKRESE